MDSFAFFKDRNVLVDESDLALLSVLQVNPLISWEALGKATGITARSAARRVEQLQEREVFWFGGVRTCGSDGQPLFQAIVMVNSAGRDDYEIFGELAKKPQVVTIERATYSVDAIITMQSTSLNRLLIHDLPLVRQTPGVSATRTLPIVRTCRHHYDWTLTDIGSEVALSLPSSSVVRRPFTQDEDQVLAEMVLQPRITVAELSRKLNLPTSRVRQIVESVLATGQIRVGININPICLGLDAECCYFLQLNHVSLPKLLTQIQNHAFVQYCHLTAGEVNTVLSVRCASLEELELVQQILLANQPQVKIKESIVTFGTTKLQGWVQEARGFMPVCFP